MMQIDINANKFPRITIDFSQRCYLGNKLKAIIKVGSSRYACHTCHAGRDDSEKQSVINALVHGVCASCQSNLDIRSKRTTLDRQDDTGKSFVSNGNRD